MRTAAVPVTRRNDTRRSTAASVCRSIQIIRPPILSAWARDRPSPHCDGEGGLEPVERGRAQGGHQAAGARLSYHRNELDKVLEKRESGPSLASMAGDRTRLPVRSGAGRPARAPRRLGVNPSGDAGARRAGTRTPATIADGIEGNALECQQTTMGRSSERLGWTWDRRRVGLGSAPLTLGSAPSWRSAAGSVRDPQRRPPRPGRRSLVR